MEAEGFGLTVAAAQRWLPLGRDVLVRGDRGAGKTTVLEGLLADASRRGVTGILLRAGGARPLSALLDHASASVRVPDEVALSDWLTEELRARRSVLLVDDADRMDDASLGVARRVLGRTGSMLVAASTADPLRAPGGGLRDLLLGRAPAEVRVQPFGFRAVATLLESVLGAPADTGLTATVMAETGGNPRAVVALADAARASGALRRQDGLWVEDGTLGEVPAEAVAYVFLSGLGPSCVGALETLASAGPVPAEVAARLVDPSALATLSDHGRVVGHELAGSGEVLAVSPPLLARALRERVSPYRRRRLAERLAAEGGGVASSATPADDLTTVLLAAPSGEGGAPAWVAQVAGLVHERATAEEGARRAEWLVQPTLATANAYLAALMRRPAAEQLEEVFARVVPGGDDDPGERAAFAFYRSRWAAWAGCGGPAALDVPEPRAPGDDAAGDGPAGDGCPGADDGRDEPAEPVDPDLAPVAELGLIKPRLLRELAAGRSAAEVAAEPEPEARVPFVRGWPSVLRAAALLEAGWPEAALEVVERADLSCAAPEPRHYLAALRGQGLLQAGRLDEAETWQRRMLDAAYDEVDALAIRVHASMLAEVLYASSQTAAAWRAVSTALRLGAPGPVGTTFYRRGLTVGAVIQAHAGNLTLAQVLVRELDRSPQAYRPLLRSIRPLAQAALAGASGEPLAGARIAREAARAYAAEGLLQPALLCWTLGAGDLDAERAAAVRDLVARTDVPLLEPYAQVVVGLVDGDRDAVAGAVSRTSAATAPALARAAEQLLGVQEGTPRPARAPVARLGGVRAEPLSAREQEVAVLAREGLSNRQIADQLYLSVRTVENHMSRALRKLGLVSRGELVQWGG
ncbi:LuxR C-terminal-related transcriptional regulator [Cellulomonas sp.]|uniref:LuxR C-terminal-related transcriptional regulator n=1 Tax=Cellulomonas sp. TaxID=40001 RepID=UPI002D329B44|nr:LuxR C-terminal-related transcriptional regulator [Cellulomonas sp.]HYQ73811.1 LuxR C-terminal-related transcriptional regulator [Cellulomonas sp.]